jgi:hypothetical protein
MYILLLYTCMPVSSRSLHAAPPAVYAWDFIHQQAQFPRSLHVIQLGHASCTDALTRPPAAHEHASNSCVATYICTMRSPRSGSVCITSGCIAQDIFIDIVEHALLQALSRTLDYTPTLRGDLHTVSRSNLIKALIPLVRIIMRGSNN